MWTIIEGTNVKLVESDEPWYIKDDLKIEGIMSNKNISLNKNEYKRQADYKSNFVINIDKPEMGASYSYAKRYKNSIKDNNAIEFFNDNKKNNYSCIYAIILTGLFVFFIIRNK
jgi:hypothetical protein